MRYDQMVSQMNKQRIEQMRKERNVEKAKIQQSILMSKQEEAKAYKLKLAQDNARKEHHIDFIQQMNQDKKQRIKFEEQIARQKAEDVRRRKFVEARAEVQRQIDEENRLIQ